MTHRNLLVLLIILVPLISFAQQRDAQIQIAREYIIGMQSKWQLTSYDVNELAVSSMHTDRRTGITHIYLNQQYRGTYIHNAMATVHLSPNAEVVHSTNRLIPDIHNKINSINPGLNATSALARSMDYLGMRARQIPEVKETLSDRSFVFEAGNISRRDIPVKLVYTQDDAGTLRLCWDLSIDQIGGTDYWSLRLDALSGELIEKTSWTTYCSFPHVHDTNSPHYCEERMVAASQAAQIKQLRKQENAGDGAAYKVFALPLEHPDEGDRSIVEEPADAEASPYGWHDTDGSDGPEYTTPRGNNVYAILDRNGDFVSDGNEPEGGSDLYFDFPFDPNAEPSSNKNAGTVNLFYVNNMLHDISWHYGFDGAAGNFQTNPYNLGGIGGDPVNALGQFGGDDPTVHDPTALNNANFSTPPDGAPPTMRMYLWDKSIAGGELLTVDAPASVEGSIQTSTTADFGVPVNENPVSGNVVVVDDGTSQGSKGCFPLVNGDEVDGNIAMIDRGDCDFSDKIYKAQQAGAIGVIICNYEDNYVNMSGGDFANEVEIPAVFITYSDCQRIRIHAGIGLQATLQAPPVPGPDSLAGDFANGVIAHEYAHGISNRLTGGSATSNCLGGEEQMGEGWSDFFQYVTTTKVVDTGAEPDFVGSYLLRNPNLGFSDRLYPYSTDFEINPSTYADITRAVVPWGVGSVWATMLWDLYWAFIDEYGYDPDLKFGQGGNNMAIQLVMEGMKLQPCTPGFVDGRDAILKADSLLYDAAHSCMIWDVFARRGLGIGADQGDPTSRVDPTESYESLPICIEELKITKQMTPLIEAGQIIQISLSGVNHLPQVSENTIIHDEIPDGLQYVPGSSSIPTQINGNMLSWDIGDLSTTETFEITYELQSDESRFSISQFFDDMESGDGNWDFLDIENFFIWDLNNVFSYSGDFSWNVTNIEEENRQVLFFRDPLDLQGATPILRFWHQYDTEPWFDGGIVEISTDGGNTYEDLGPQLFRNPYDGEIKGNAFGLRKPAFWGDSEGWIETYADLSPWAGESVIIRFHFASDAEVGALGWFVDDVEIMDAEIYNSQSCISNNGGIEACAFAKGYGTIVQPGIPTNIDEVTPNDWLFQLAPNPATENLVVNITAAQQSELELSLFNITGIQVWQDEISVFSGQQNRTLDVSDLKPGFYIMHLYDVKNGTERTQKVIVK